MDLKYHNSYLCVSPLWTCALHRQDEGVGGLIIIWPCVNSYHVCMFASARVWYVWASFPGVRYLEANLYWKVTLGAGVLSALRKRGASASWRLRMYYNHAKSNP